MHLSAELIGGAASLVGLGILTLASIRSIGRRGSSAGGETAAAGPGGLPIRWVRTGGPGFPDGESGFPGPREASASVLTGMMFPLRPAHWPRRVARRAERET